VMPRTTMLGHIVHGWSKDSSFGKMSWLLSNFSLIRKSQTIRYGVTDISTEISVLKLLRRLDQEMRLWLKLNMYSKNVLIRTLTTKLPGSTFAVFTPHRKKKLMPVRIRRLREFILVIWSRPLNHFWRKKTGKITDFVRCVWLICIKLKVICKKL